MSQINHARSTSPLLIVVTLATGVLVGACSQGSKGAGGTAASDTAAITTPSANAVTPTSGVAASTAGSVPPAVAAVGSYGESLYDAVKAGSWAQASSITDSLNTAVHALPSGGQGSGAEQQQQLAAELDTLHRAIPAKQQSVALKAANRVTYLEARMTAQYRPATPAEVLLLDYYGRELEIWSGEKNASKLSQTSADLQQTWNTLRPAIQAHGRAGQATHTDDLVKRIASAKSPTQYAQLAKPFLDEVDELEKVFTKQ